MYKNSKDKKTKHTDLVTNTKALDKIISSRYDTEHFLSTPLSLIDRILVKYYYNSKLINRLFRNRKLDTSYNHKDSVKSFFAIPKVIILGGITSEIVRQEFILKMKIDL